jgi:hypothetical protein
VATSPAWIAAIASVNSLSVVIGHLRSRAALSLGGIARCCRGFRAVFPSARRC